MTWMLGPWTYPVLTLYEHYVIRWTTDPIGLFLETIDGIICCSTIGFLWIRSNICWKLKINICPFLEKCEKEKLLHCDFQRTLNNTFTFCSIKCWQQDLLKYFHFDDDFKCMSHNLWISRYYFDLSCQMSSSESESIFVDRNKIENPVIFEPWTKLEILHWHCVTKWMLNWVLLKAGWWRRTNRGQSPSSVLTAHPLLLEG